MKHFPIHPHWAEVLRKVLSEARGLGSAAVVAFDLDSTLLDNRPRQARIAREFGAAHGIPALEAITAEHFESGFDLRGALVRAGLSSADLERWMPALRAHWLQHFFTSDLCREDIPVRGAAAFVGRIAGAGAQVVYLTGRREEMRPGTEHVLGAFGFPIPGGRVALWMKPDPELHDDVFKREAHRRLGTLGRVIAAFDNEPHHVNDYRASFPAAAVIHLGTDHSGRLDMLSEGVVTVPHFEFREPDETL